MQVGYLFRCNNAVLTECIRNKNYPCVGKQVNAVQDMEANSVIFLLNDETGTMVGPFTAARDAEALIKGTWYTSVDTKNFSANINVAWERLHELKNASDKIPFLKEIKECPLSSLHTQMLLTELKKSPLYPEPKKP